MVQVLMALWVANRKVYGADKLCKAARRAGRPGPDRPADAIGRDGRRDQAPQGVHHPSRS